MLGLFVVTFAMTLITATSTATPNVVDQYTEQIPTPGGKKPTNNVGVNGGDSTNSRQSGSESGSNASGSPGSAGTGSGYYGSGASTSAGGADGASVVAGSGGDSGGSGAASRDRGPGDGGTADSVGSSSSDYPALTSPSGSESVSAIGEGAGNEGMGWLFPAILIGSAVILAALTVVRVARRANTST